MTVDMIPFLNPYGTINDLSLTKQELKITNVEVLESHRFIYLIPHQQTEINIRAEHLAQVKPTSYWSAVAEHEPAQLAKKAKGNLAVSGRVWPAGAEQ